MNHFREIITILLFLFVISFKGNQIIAHEHGYSTKEYNNTMKWGSKKKKKKNFLFLFIIKGYRPNLYFGMKTRDIVPTQLGFLCKFLI